jgi:hypothetical protein
MPVPTIAVVTGPAGWANRPTAAAPSSRYGAAAARRYAGDAFRELAGLLRVRS